MPGGEPAQNCTAFRWSRVRERAAELVAADELSDEDIARQCGIARRTLATWKRHSGFEQRVAEHHAAWRAAIRAEGIANRQNRINALNDRWERMQRIIEERAADTVSGMIVDEIGEEHVIPGWSTGLLVRQEKPHGTEFAVDTGLLRELRAHEEQAAKELGQWVEKQEETLNATDSFIDALREFGRGRDA